MRRGSSGLGRSTATSSRLIWDVCCTSSMEAVGQGAAKADELRVSVADVFDLEHDGLAECGEAPASLQVLRQVALEFVEHAHERLVKLFRLVRRACGAQERGFRL